ncbi:MAG TPA: hypothetical protein VMY87_07125 [Armatimonadota bacterium]|nr:hypothetical protein [Armatimonadota bacterium]
MSDLFPSLIPEFAAVGQALWRALRCCSRGLKKSARVFVLYLLPLFIVIHLVATAITGAQLRSTIEDLKSKGVILPAEELIPSVPPGEDNAADLYLAAAKALRLSDDEDSLLFGPDREQDAHYYAVARDVVAANEDYYRLLDDATRLNHSAFPTDWRASPHDFRYLAEARQAARMLSLRAYVAAQEGRPDDALASLGACFRMADHVQSGPTILAHLVSLAIQGIAEKALEQILCGAAPSASAARDFADQLAAIDNTSASIFALKSELVIFGLPVFEILRSGEMSLAELASGTTGGVESRKRIRRLAFLGAWLRRPVVNANERFYLRYMDDHVSAFKLPWPESQQAVDGIDNSLPHDRPWSFIAEYITPVFSRVVWSRDRATASVRAAAIALALKAYRADHGAYPDSLSALEAAGWTLPTDPFGGGPYHYRREGAGFVVWSIGPDVDDDNAARDYDAYREQTQDNPEERERNPYDYDVIFRCSS